MTDICRTDEALRARERWLSALMDVETCDCLQPFAVISDHDEAKAGPSPVEECDAVAVESCFPAVGALDVSMETLRWRYIVSNVLRPFYLEDLTTLNMSEADTVGLTVSPAHDRRHG